MPLMTDTPNGVVEADKFGHLFGYPIKHSLSPLMHNTIFQNIGLNWHYSLLESLDMSQFLKLTKDPNFYGSAVTMPHKLAILPHLDSLTPSCREVGACNTIYLRTIAGVRTLIGTNTDVIGVRDAFYANVSDPDSTFHDRPAMVIGGGGAARSAVYALKKWMRATRIYIVNRDDVEVAAVIKECEVRGFGEGLLHVRTPEEAEGLEGPGAIVACVPNFPPKTAEEVRARGVIEVMLAKEHKGAILEMCYHPVVWTEIAEASQREGWKVIIGTEAMIYQGIEQAKLWTGLNTEELPVDKVHKAIADELAKGQHA
ncbi:shikimate dehydrogenase substrate binding domain-containing protein [Aulographum hederae CBS 113979]|uniref:Shikimate dehydrogenase substrate binding domain-containing protein n=1 Tax=Aulographum hederae CBS 113979 TaxID=1176131 RepID=A0A6G1H224_9PEZI|nr:shikimate dehydrogenase substrate binding domain-containing protein [Aulographum hederae CBS 113979]